MARRPRPFPLQLRPWVPLLAVAAVASLVACGRPAADPVALARSAEAGRLGALAGLGPVPPATRGYIVVSFDTLRADHLGAYGYERDTSPFFDSLAARGTVFERALVQYPSTLTSHMSIFTGLYPAEHGVLPPDSVLAPEIETFPEVFQRAGFKTAGFTEGGFMRGRFGFRRGFDTFLARDRQGPREIERTFERGVRFLEGLGPEDRFLLFLHTYAVHAPYRPPEGYEDLYGFDAPPSDAFPPTGPQLVRVDAEQRPLSPELIDWLKAGYDATIRHADDTLAHFFDQLERLGLSDQVTVVLTSDHGEEFREHGHLNHTQLYQEVMHVPLVVLHPRLGPGRYEPLVESVDLAPTLYELAGLTPAGRPSGVSVARALGRTVRAGEGVGRTLAYAEEGGGQRALWRLAPETAAGDPAGAETGSWLHLLTFEPPAGAWVPRWLAFDTAKTTLDFEARSFGVGRPLSLAIPGTPPSETAQAWTFAVGTEWTRIHAELPPLGAGRVERRAELRVPGCTVPPEVETLRQWRCYGFRVRGLPLTRVELYDLRSDPGEERDLSLETAAPARTMVRLLRQSVFRLRAAAGRETLDPEAERNLRALGYLQ